MRSLRIMIVVALALVLATASYAGKVQQVVASAARTADHTVDFTNNSNYCGAIVTVDVSASSDDTPVTAVTLRHAAIDKISSNIVEIVAFSPFFKDGTYAYYIGGADSPLPQNFRLTFDHLQATALTYSAEISWLWNCTARGKLPYTEALLPLIAWSASEPTFDLYNSYGHCGLLVYVNVTVDGAAASITPTIQAVDPVGGDALAMGNALTAFAATGDFVYFIGSDGDGTYAGESDAPLPYHFKLAFIRADDDAITYSVGQTWLTHCGLGSDDT